MFGQQGINTKKYSTMFFSNNEGTKGIRSLTLEYLEKNWDIFFLTRSTLLRCPNILLTKADLILRMTIVVKVSNVAIGQLLMSYFIDLINLITIL